MAAIGVHLGATCACAAVYKDGRADVVANDAGDRVTPAVVAFSESEEVVGLAAKQSRIRNISNTVVKVKQILGRSSGDPQAEKYIAESKCSIIEKNGKLQYEIDNKLINPEDVAKLIFSKMKETAQSALGSDVNDVVITVPFDFEENQKNALGEAAAAAGFNVMRLIHEPSAALLAYGIGQDSPTGKSNVLVYKLGGTSLSITVIEVNSGIYRVLATNTDDSIGGVCFTEALAQHLASEFQRFCKHDIRGNPRAMMKLMNSADVAKHSLSTLGSANCFVDSLYDGLDFDCNVSRARFELICSSLFSKCVEAIKKLLQQVGFTADDINKGVDESGADKFTVLFPSGTPLPARRQHTLHAPGNTSSVCLELYESLGQSPMNEEGKFAQIVLQDLDKKEDGLHDILTVLTMKRDGSLHVTCTDQDTGKFEIITVEVAS
ncbi:heat shock 70 kDa protein 14 isoform X3 [Grus americana]|uniref:heat shock 70 kDa protein 14 isoform X3 n=1 Tax=Grus americana TaxID=9117 RepID=UPI002407BD70|nr:heat shock 70 kDa protein 14 isoform X3 [Grus americana]